MSKKRNNAKRRALRVLGYKDKEFNRFFIQGEGYLPKNFRIAVEHLHTNDVCECQSVPIFDRKSRLRGFVVRGFNGRVSVSTLNNIGPWEFSF
jgi:hypothetical protein